MTTIFLISLYFIQCMKRIECESSNKKMIIVFKEKVDYGFLLIILFFLFA